MGTSQTVQPSEAGMFCAKTAMLLKNVQAYNDVPVIASKLIYPNATRIRRN